MRLATLALHCDTFVLIQTADELVCRREKGMLNQVSHDM